MAKLTDSSDESRSSASEEERVNDRTMTKNSNLSREQPSVPTRMTAETPTMTGDDENEDGNEEAGGEVSKREKARLRVMQRLKKQKIKELLDAQNAAIDADMLFLNNKGKGRLKYLLQQTEIFAHFANSGVVMLQKLLKKKKTENILRKRKTGYLGEETRGYSCNPLVFMEK